MSAETKKRLNTLLTVLPASMLALIMGVSPRSSYESAAELLAFVVPVRSGAQHQPVDRWLAYLVLCLIPLVAVDSWRATRVLSGTLLQTLVFFFGVAVPFLMPAALIPLMEAFGDGAVIAAFILWPITTFSVVAFTVAAAQVDAEQQGRQPHTLFLSLLHHFGGFVGVYFASVQFPESKTCAETLKTIPRGLIFLAAAIAVCVLLGLL